MGDGVIAAPRIRAWPLERRAGAVGWTVVGVCVAVWAVIGWQIAHPAPDRVPLGWGIWALAFAAVGAFALLLAITGALIVQRRPRNPIGWANVLGGLGATTASLGLIGGSQLLGASQPPEGVQLAAFVSAAALQSSVAIFALVPLWFPDGPSSAGRWALLAWLVPVAVGIRFLELFFQHGEDWLFPLYPSAAAPANPYEATGILGSLWAADHVIGTGYWLSGAVVVLAGVAVARRFRRSEGVERRQLLWFTGAAVLITPTTIAFVYMLLALPPATSQADAVVALFYLMLMLPTLATLIAIRRYRLYEIDRIVNRALVYAGLTAILAGVFAATITVSEKAFAAVTGQSSDAALVLTTVIVTAAYTPLHGRLERVVARHARYADPRFGPYRDELTRALETLDPRRALARLVREAVEQLHADGGAALVELSGGLQVAATVGTWSPADTVLIVPIGAPTMRIGELHLMARAGGEPYRPGDVATLTSVADLAAQTIVASETALSDGRADRLGMARPTLPP